MKKMKFLILVLMAFLLPSSCDLVEHHSSDDYDAKTDSIFQAQLENIQNPQFMTISEIVDYRENHFSNLEIDSVFFSLSPATIQNVASVLLKKKPLGITKRDIVEEFRRCSDIYSNLPTSPKSTTSNGDSLPVDKTGTDLGTRPDGKRIAKTSYQTRTDTINGEPVKVTIKTEEYYE